MLEGFDGALRSEKKKRNPKNDIERHKHNSRENDQT